MRIPGSALLMVGLLFVLAVIPLNIHAQQQRVEVQLSSNRVSIDESVMMSVRAYSLDEELDASNLADNFDVTKVSSSRQVTIENGRQTSVVEWVLELMPKRKGALEVAPIIVGSEQSRPLTLLVEEAASGSARDLYVEASVDVSDPYVQSQVIYTLRVFQDIQFLNASLNMPTIDGALIQQLGKERNYQESVDGRNYRVSEIRYTIVPQKSGEVLIPSIVLNAVVPVNRNQVPNTRTRTRNVSRRANDITLNVLARPDGLDGSWWLPAKEVNIIGEWSGPLDQLVVDQPITRTIKLLARGVADSQLPPIDAPKVNGISIYADSPSSTSGADENGLLAQQISTWAVIPQRAGELVLPEVKVNWFDTVTNEARVAVLPEQRLVVSAAVGINGNATGSMTEQETVGNFVNSGGDSRGDGFNAADSERNTNNALLESDNASAQAIADANNVLAKNNSSLALEDALKSKNKWRNAAMLMLTGWLLSLLLFWWRTKRTVFAANSTKEPSKAKTDSAWFKRRASSSIALDPIESACETADVSKITQQLLAWGEMVWPKSPPRHIAEIANRLQYQPLADTFKELDAQQFSQNGSVNAMAFDEIPALLKTAVEQYPVNDDTATDAYALPSL